MSGELITSLISSLGVGGVLAWYLWYTTTVQWPKMLDSFRADRDDFRQELAEERRQRNGLYMTLRDLLDELRHRPCLLDERRKEEVRGNDGP